MPDSESLLYHFTTTDGLIGIISKSEIWATEILYLNDHSEAAYRYRLQEDLAGWIRSQQFTKDNQPLERAPLGHG